MGIELRSASLIDLFAITTNRRRQRVLRLNPPYTLVQPDALMHDLLRSQLPVKPQVSFVYVAARGMKVLGYVQARCRWRRRDEWTITTLGAGDGAPEDVWEKLIEAVCIAAGEAGVIRLFAKIPDSPDLQELFRSFGFTSYTRERIWGNLYFDAHNVASEPPLAPMRRHTGRDAWELHQLYRSITPPAAQRAESLTTRQWQVSHIPRPWFFQQGLLENAYVWPDQRPSERGSTSIGGFVRLLTGARGHWITMLFRPEAANRELCAQGLDYVLWKAARLGTKPVYCAVREYQAEVESLLDERGFHMLNEQSLLVKYIAEPVKEAQPALAPFLVPTNRELVRLEMAPPNPAAALALFGRAGVTPTGSGS